MIKVKRKRQPKTKRMTESGSAGWLARLFEPVPLDFTANGSTEECIARLESFRKDRWWHSPKTRVTITPVDDATHRFHIRRTHNGIHFTEADGYLQYWVGNQTCVSGEVSSRSKIFAGTPVVVIAMAVVYFAYPASAGYVTLIAGWWLLATVSDVFTYRSLRRELAETIKTMLGY